MVVKKTTKGKKGKSKSSPAVVEYLSAVDQLSMGHNEDEVRISDNMQSLLREHVVNMKDAAFFAPFVTQFRAVISDEDTNILSRCQKKLLHGLAEETLLNQLDKLYEEYTFATAKDASLTDDIRRRQEESQHTEDSLVYGEIDLEGFCRLLQSLPLKPGGKFYDLGSGSGRAVFAARFQEDFDECIGLELLPNLHQLATSVQSLYKFLYKHDLKCQNVSFYCTDLLEYDWSTVEASIVYAPSLLFDSELMEGIATRALNLREGAYLLSLKKFDSKSFHNGFEMMQENVVPMSWGEAIVYVYRKTHDG